MTKKLTTITAVLALLLGAAACTTEADTVNENLSKEAEGFKVERRIVFVNGITDKYLLTIQGRCSIENDGRKVDVICKVGDGQYKRNTLGLSDNVTYVSEQVETSDVDPFRYKLVFRPESIVPDIDLQTSGDAQ
ncbi:MULTISPECIES: hypothetical protein [unclassified Aeromicrobium]|uniref:beta-sandwich lipoprotein n=1 Tax=unclassified Aeromicrobium TaxID=2633570 RepID=UPI00288BBE2E|nr:MULTISPECIES: hypothetical protein [unclassified Aeromicrobium]